MLNSLKLTCKSSVLKTEKCDWALVTLKTEAHTGGEKRLKGWEDRLWNDRTGLGFGGF
jgi:hypothetical protein